MKKRCEKALDTTLGVLNMVEWDVIAAYSARATLFIVISFFPFMIMLLSLLQYLPFDLNRFSALFLELIPELIRDLIVAILDEIKAPTDFAVFPIAAVTTLWSASTGIMTLMKGLNAVYKRHDTRNYFVIRGVSILYTLIFIVLLIAVLIILVFGNGLFQWLKVVFPFLQNSFALIISLRAIVSIVLLTLFFWMLYKTVPNGISRWFAELPGALLSAVAWMAFSYLYSLYISHMGSFSRVYGSLTAVVLLLIWLYACMYIVFIGAKINVMLQSGKLKTIFMKKTAK